MIGSLLLQVPVWGIAQYMPEMNLLELFLFGCITYGPVAALVGLLIMPRADQRYIVGLLPRRLAAFLRVVLPHLRDSKIGLG